MKIYTFPVRVAGTNIFVSHINDMQTAITYLSRELTNGIGTESDPKVFKVSAAADGYASLNIPAATATPTAPASGDLWNDAGNLKFYNGSATKTVTYSDHTHSISDVSSLQSSLDLKAALASPTFTGTVTAPIIESGRLNLDYGDFGGTVKAIRWRTTAQSAGTAPLGAGLYQANNNTLYIQAGTANSIIFRDYNTGLGANVATLSTGTTPTFTVNTGSFTTLSATSINATTTLTQNNVAVSLSGHTHAEYAPLASPTFTGTVTLPTTTTKFGTTAGVLKAAVTTGNLSVGTVGLAAASGEVSGTLPIANGGTGQTTATAATNALLPSQTSNSGKYLTTDGTNTSWATVSAGGATNLDGLSDVAITAAATGDMLLYTGSNFVDVEALGAITLIIGDGVNTISTGYQDVSFICPFACDVTHWAAVSVGGTSAQTGVIQFKVVKSTLTDYPTATNIGYVLGGASSTVGWSSTAAKSGTAVTAVTATIAQNDILRVDVSSVTSLKLVAIHLRTRRTA